jgi:hypothetical protein
MDIFGLEGLNMPAQLWRERREAYLRERGRLADLCREGYVENGLVVIKGGCRRVAPNHPALIVIHHTSGEGRRSNRPGETPVGEPAA